MPDNDRVAVTGIGSNLHIYDIRCGQEKYCCEVLPCTTLHGIRGNTEIDQRTDQNNDDVKHWCCFGAKSVRIWTFHKQDDRLEFLSDSWQCEDWIWEVCWLVSSLQSTSTLALALGHNVVVEWDWQSSTVLQRVASEESCILYSAHFIGQSWSDLILAAGTVFNQVVIWSVSGRQTDQGKCPVLHRLTGHQGVIFSIDYSPELRRLCSVSDDRSIRMWQISTPEGSTCSPGSLPDWSDVKFTLLQSLYGHSARIWSGKLLKKCLVSVGEDATCCVWDYEGNIIQKYKGHKGKSIWSLAVCPNETFVATGGGDHSIRLWRLEEESSNHGTSGDVALRLLPPDMSTGDFPRIVSLGDFNHVLVMTNNGCLYELNIEDDTWLTLLVDEEFRSYSVLSPSPNGRVLALGSISGRLKIIMRKIGNLDQAHTELTERVYDGRLFSIHWLTHSVLLTTGPLGLMYLWRVKNSHDSSFLVKEGCYVLPPCKQRWVSAASMVPRQSLLVCGDRGGTVHVYVHGEGTGHTYEYEQSPPPGEQPLPPVQSFPKLHGKAGVTCVCCHGDLVYTCGRDGLYRQYMCVGGRLQLQHANKVLKGFDWLDRLMFVEDDMLVLGFHSSKFVVWNTTQNQRLVEIECGGGHRTWACHLHDSKGFRFVFIKINDVMLCETSLSSKQIILKNSLHGRDLTDVKHVTLMEYGGENINLLLTSSEDTNIALIGVSAPNETVGVPSGLSVLHTLHSHISSVRTMALSCKPSRSASPLVHQVLMFSAGGRAQITVWRLSFNKFRDLTSKYNEETSAEISRNIITANTNAEQTLQKTSGTMHSCDCGSVSTDATTTAAAPVSNDISVLSISTDCDFEHERIAPHEDLICDTKYDKSSAGIKQSLFRHSYCTSFHQDISESLQYELLTTDLLCEPNRRRSKPWKHKFYNPNPETRYMDLTTFPGNQVDPNIPASIHFLGAACSDAFIRLFIFDEGERTLTCLGQSSYHDHCLLHIGHFTHTDFSSNQTKIFLFSGATDGKVAFWDITPIVKIIGLSNPGNSAIESDSRSSSTSPEKIGVEKDSVGEFGDNLSGKSGGSETVTCIAEEAGRNVTNSQSPQMMYSQDMVGTGGLEAPIFTISCHQSGVNSIDVHKCTDTGAYMVVTGGDDNSVSLHTVTVDVDTRGMCHFTLLSQYCKPDAHAAQVTGIRVLDGRHLLSVSIDQRLCLWEIIHQSDILQAIQMKCCKFINVSDISGMDVWEDRTVAGWYGVAVCGQALQILNICLSGT